MALARGVTLSISPQKLKDETDFEFRRSKVQWWMDMRPMMKILARHDSTYNMPKPDLVNLDEYQTVNKL
jgi:hypothetical protein